METRLPLYGCTNREYVPGRPSPAGPGLPLGPHAGFGSGGAGGKRKPCRHVGSPQPRGSKKKERDMVRVCVCVFVNSDISVKMPLRSHLPWRNRNMNPDIRSGWEMPWCEGGLGLPLAGLCAALRNTSKTASA